MGISLAFIPDTRAQFYNGSNMTFGKNRVQYREFLWTYYRFEDFNVYFYKGGRNLAEFAAKYSMEQIPELEKKIESTLTEKIQFIVYNSLSDLKQSNIGLTSDQNYNTGGITHIVGNKVFLYYDGNHINFQRQIRAAISRVILSQMLYGGSIGSQIKNSALLTVPDWYVNGLLSYLSEGWNTEIDNRVRDGILSGRYKKITRLEGEEALYAGHSLWRYISLKYGKSALANIVHMTQISRNIQNGFLYVLGLPFQDLLDQWYDFYDMQYQETRMLTNDLPQPLDLKYRFSRRYSQPVVSPDGNFLAYVTNEMGLYKIYLLNLQTGKKQKLFKSGFRLDDKVDYSYPLLQWHPSGKVLTYILERKGHIWLNFYNIAEKKLEKRKMLAFQKITSFSYSPDGRELVLSGVQNGKSDIYVFNIAANTPIPITSDYYTDIDPIFTDKGNKIMFSSNRPTDTLDLTDQEIPSSTGETFDLFFYDRKSTSNILKRITHTPLANELQAQPFSGEQFTYLSDENGIYNTYLGAYDSAINYIDTTIHYRYFIRSLPQTNQAFNVLEQHNTVRAGKQAKVILSDNTTRLYLEDMVTREFDADLPGTSYRNLLTNKTSNNKQTVAFKKPQLRQKSRESRKRFVSMYKGGTDGLTIKQSQVSNPTTFGSTETGSISASGPGAFEKPTIGSGVGDSFVLPKRLNYRVEYYFSQLVTQIDFNYINYNYQPFTGGGAPIYLNPGFNVFLQVGMADLLENHRMVGGVRLNLNLIGNEYIFSYANLEKRLDKEVVFHRVTIENQEFTNVPSLTRTHSHELYYILKWPFNEVLSVRGTGIYRNDMKVYLATDQANLSRPTTFQNWLGVKGELVYDATRNIGMNLYYGMRGKIFGEYYHLVNSQNDNLMVLGFDVRHYQKVFRSMIWANRIAASTSFGTNRLIYYMGGVDNWLFPTFNQLTPIDFDQNYAYQTLATNMRGFNQNIRNGNSFAVINTELRFPVFRVLSAMPINSDFLRNFQLVAFGDVGTAWTGWNPYSPENALFTRFIENGPLLISVTRQKEPLVAGFGLGARVHLLGYFIRGDLAWGVEDGIIRSPVAYLSLSLDF